MPDWRVIPLRGVIGSDHLYGPWSVQWKEDEFVLPRIGSFPFKNIVLPVEICITSTLPDCGFAIITLETMFRFEILHGASGDDLARFKKMLSRCILAGLKFKPYYCSDCGRDAGLLPTRGSSRFCRACRQPYCKNPDCLKRLRLDSSPDGTLSCRSCGTAAGEVAS
jgi:hypothetical protein